LGQNSLENIVVTIVIIIFSNLLKNNNMIQGSKFKYWLLDNKDIVQKGDQYYDPGLDKWIKVSDGKKDKDDTYRDAIIGYEYDFDKHKPIRRKNSNIK
jgi:hypothetical protein